MITNVKLVNICVKDQTKALDFYTKTLGFEVLDDQPFGPDMRWLELAPKGGQTRVTLFTAPGQEDRIGSFTGISFQCDDVRATYNDLSKKGVEFTQEPTEQPGGLMAVFKDLDGNEFVLSKD